MTETGNRAKELLKSHKDRIPIPAQDGVIRLSGLDDGGHMGECMQMQRDLNVYPALEAAIMGYSYMPETNADRFAEAVMEYLGLGTKPFCECCGHRDPKDFGENKRLCRGCIEDGVELQVCGVCGKDGYEGDLFCSYIIADDEIVEALAAHGISASIDDQLTPEMCDKLELGYTAMDDACRIGLVERSWDKDKGAVWLCQRCLDKGKEPEDARRT